MLLIPAFATAPAAIEETDRVQVGLAGRNTTRGFSPALYLTVTTLSGFRRVSFDGDSGGWEGPVCDVASNPNLSKPVSLTWGAGFDDRVRNAETAARDRLTFDWDTIESGRLTVTHLVAGARVGTIAGSYVLTDARGETGYHESALAIPLARGVYAAVEFWSRGNALACTVEGVPVAAWHRDVARRALANVRLEGNLPPARVFARAVGGRVAGTVRDSFGHPDAGVAVRLERRVGAAWRAVRSGRTATGGTYSLRTSGSGSYRVVATLAGVSARSAVIRGRS